MTKIVLPEDWDKNKPTMTQEELLEKMQEALKIWTCQYSPEHCDEKTIKECRDIVWFSCGTLNYIASLSREIDRHLEKIGK